MISVTEHHQAIFTILANNANDEVALKSQRYFPNKINILGVSNGDVMHLADEYIKTHLQLTVQCRLSIAEELIAQGKFHEEVLMGFAFLRKIVKKNFDDSLIERFEYWLDHNLTNWAQCDDLCLKVIYNYFLGRPYLITQIGHWADAKSPWTRRAANVVLVKFIHRKIGKNIYQLPKSVIFVNCKKLLHDPDIYVQKSIGWLLKVAADYHHEDVTVFLIKNIVNLERHTLRYAIEKFPVSQRKELMGIGKNE